MSQVSLPHFLLLAAVLFVLGLICVLTRRQAVAILIGIELMLNAAGINFVAFSRYGTLRVDGAVFVLFVIALAAAEAVVALSLIFALQRRWKTVDVDRASSLKG
jgi:NADH:ubiquinone oxidoreductase subunit K